MTGTWPEEANSITTSMWEIDQELEQWLQKFEWNRIFKDKDKDSYELKQNHDIKTYSITIKSKKEEKEDKHGWKGHFNNVKRMNDPEKKSLKRHS
jgi:hypothetical protein